MYGVPDLPLSGSTRDESTEVEHTMYNVFNKTICVCYYTNSSSGLLFIMCGYCYYIDPAAVRTCMQTNFTVHGQPPQFLIASAANVCMYAGFHSSLDYPLQMNQAAHCLPRHQTWAGYATSTDLHNI